MVSARLPYTPDPDSVVGWTLVRVARVLERRFDEAMREVGLTPSQFGVLSAVAADPGIGSGRLARQALVTPQSAGELVSVLEKAGHVSRDRSGGRGHRAGITVTDAGWSKLEAGYAAIAVLNQPAELGLDPADLPILNALLHKMLPTPEN